MLGADDGNRTRVTGLGNQCSTIELHPQDEVVGNYKSYYTPKQKV